jgi:glycosyltransferase involved in cell wall biosynthesis
VDKVNPLKGRGVLFINENLPLPFDTRPWQEALALRGAGMEVAMLCPRGKGYEASYECLKGIHIYRHPFPVEAGRPLEYLVEYGLSLLLEFFYSLKIYRRVKFEVIHVSNPPDLLFLISLLHKITGVRLVFDHHDVCPEVWEAKFGRKGMFYRLLLLFEKWSFLVSDLVISTNESYRDVALKRGRVPPGKIFVVRSGPDLSRFPETIPREEALKQGKKYMVGYVGVIEHQEGLDFLVKVVGEIVRRYHRRDILFVIIGGGTQLARVKDLVDKEDLKEFFHFTGRVPDPVLFRYLGNSEVCVNPDLFNDASNRSTMRKIMEYMALGKPMVQTEVVEGKYTAGEASLYARPGDRKDFAEKILFLLDHPQIAGSMGASGKKRILETLRWDVQKKNLIRAYQTLLGGNPE